MTLTPIHTCGSVLQHQRPFWGLGGGGRGKGNKKKEREERKAFEPREDLETQKAAIDKEAGLIHLRWATRRQRGEC